MKHGKPKETYLVTLEVYTENQLELEIISM